MAVEGPTESVAKRVSYFKKHFNYHVRQHVTYTVKSFVLKTVRLYGINQGTIYFLQFQIKSLRFLHFFFFLTELIKLFRCTNYCFIINSLKHSIKNNLIKTYRYVLNELLIVSNHKWSVHYYRYNQRIFKKKN